MSVLIITIYRIGFIMTTLGMFFMLVTDLVGNIADPDRWETWLFVVGVFIFSALIGLIWPLYLLAIAFAYTKDKIYH
jgi:hypothetical protein